MKFEYCHFNGSTRNYTQTARQNSSYFIHYGYFQIIFDAFVWFRSDSDNEFQSSDAITQTDSRCSKTPTVSGTVSMHRSCPLSMSCGSKDRKLCSLFCTNDQSDPWSHPRISKRPIDSFDMVITLIIYKLALPISSRGFCSRNPYSLSDAANTWFVKTHFSGALSSSGTANCVLNRNHMNIMIKIAKLCNRRLRLAAEIFNCAPNPHYHHCTIYLSTYYGL